MESHFFNFFEENWQLRHYGRECGKSCDEVIKNAQTSKKKQKIEPVYSSDKLLSLASAGAAVTHHEEVETSSF